MSVAICIVNKLMEENNILKKNWGTCFIFIFSIIFYGNNVALFVVFFTFLFWGPRLMFKEKRLLMEEKKLTRIIFNYKVGFHCNRVWNIMH